MELVTKNDRQQEEMGKTETYNSGAEQSGGGGVGGVQGFRVGPSGAGDEG